MCAVQCGRGGVLPEKKRFWQTPLTIVEEKGDVIIFLKDTVNTVKFIIKYYVVWKDKQLSSLYCNNTCNNVC